MILLDIGHRDSSQSSFYLLPVLNDADMTQKHEHY